MVTPTASRLDQLNGWFRNLNPWLVDAVIGTVFTVISVASVFSEGDSQRGYADPDALAVILALGCALPFYVRRRAPLFCVLASTASLVVLALLDYRAGAQSQMLLVAVYSVGSYEAGLRRLLGFLGVEAGVAIVIIVGITDSDTTSLVGAGAFYARGLLLRRRDAEPPPLPGAARGARGDRRAEHEEAAARVIADERLRIAQELHDVVAHSMGVIAVQAGVGAHVIDTDPAEAKRSLDAISVTSRTALTEIRRLLGVLRADGDTAAYAPAPGLADLTRLVADIEAAGVGVDLVVEGTPRDLPPGIDLTAYRIVQEALTNVLKHAGPARAAVTVGYEPDAVTLEVVDDGPPTNGRNPDGGHGILGMRERVAVYGGAIDVGPKLGGGFRVAARLPFGSDAS